MGPRLFHVKKGETTYSLKLLPIGGSCMMLGEDEENPAEGAFQNASIPGRMAVIAAGPVFNFILAFFLALILVGTVSYIHLDVYKRQILTSCQAVCASVL